MEAVKKREVWVQDPVDSDLWHHESGLIVNTAALEERSAYYLIIRQGAAHRKSAPPSEPRERCLV